MPIKSAFHGEALQLHPYNPKIAVSTVMPVTKIRFGLCARRGVIAVAVCCAPHLLFKAGIPTRSINVRFWG
jgi:hypothetical protein